MSFEGEKGSLSLRRRKLLRDLEALPVLTKERSNSEKIKITAMLDENLIETTKAWTQASTTTEAITIALEEWQAMKALQRAYEGSKEEPLETH